MWLLRPGVPDGLRPLILLTDRSQDSALAEPGAAFPPSQLRSPEGPAEARAKTETARPLARLQMPRGFAGREHPSGSQGP